VSDGERGVVGREAPSVDREPVIKLLEAPETDPPRILRRSESKKEKSRPFSRSTCIKQVSVFE
jgi:hypothetical protein